MKRLIVLCMMLCGLLCGCLENQAVPAVPEAQGNFTLTFITVGKGDAFLMESPEGNYYLMDTGKAQDYQQIMRILQTKAVDRLSGIFLSHGHKDHAGCLEPLLEALAVDRVYISAADHISYTEIDPRKIVPQFPETELVELQGGEVLDLGGATARVWIPPVTDTENANNNSLVLRVTHGDRSFLLMGDCELEEEAQLMGTDFPLDATVLKLGHHGETDASSPQFLDRVQPELALIAGNAEENPDSVNPFISAMLQEREIVSYYSEGPSLDFISDGTAVAVSPVAEQKFPCTLDLRFNDVNRKEQAVTIRNAGTESADLTGCTLISERGDEIYHIPPDTVLAPGGTLTIVCRDSSIQGDLIWNCSSVWKKKGDRALLYDRYMNLLDENTED